MEPLVSISCACLWVGMCGVVSVYGCMYRLFPALSLALAFLFPFFHFSGGELMDNRTQ